jgi:hypothetical protein
LALDDLSPQRASIVAIGLSVAGMGLVTPLLRSAVAQLAQLLYKDWHEITCQFSARVVAPPPDADGLACRHGAAVAGQ